MLLGISSSTLALGMMTIKFNFVVIILIIIILLQEDGVCKGGVW